MRIRYFCHYGQLTGYGRAARDYLAALALHLRGRVFTDRVDSFSGSFQLDIVAYEDLSSAGSADILERLDPDLIICDEAHCLSSYDSARRKRFDRFAKEHPGCRYAFLSGTMTSRSVNDYATFCEMALKKNSPLPRGYREVRDWGGALDVKPEYVMSPGVLTRLCGPGEDVRAGYMRRLTETPGVVMRSESDLATSLIIRRLNPKMPPPVIKLLDQVRKTWKIGDEEFSEATALARKLREISAGFYYRWAWPDGKDFEWLEARAAWNCEVRDQLSRSRAGMDSPYLLELAAERHYAGKKTGAPVWAAQTWPAWRAVKDRPLPPKEAVWVDDFLVKESLKWGEKMTKKGRAIIWCDHVALAERIAADGKLPHFGAGTDASQSKLPLIVCSIDAQSTGKNLQAYEFNLITTLMPSGKGFEQLVARTHRNGQTADEVIVDWMGHTPELQRAMLQIIEDADYVQATTGGRQRVLRATRT